MMYSLHDITKVCPKIECVSGDDGVHEEHETASNHSDDQMDRMSEEYPLENNNINMKDREHTFENARITATGEEPSPSKDTSISLRGDISSSSTAVENTSARQPHVSGTGSTHGDSINGQPTVSVYRNVGLEPLSNSENGQKVNARTNEPRKSPPGNFNPEREREASYRTVWIAGNDQKIYARTIQSPTTPQHVTLEGHNESLYRSVWTAGDDLKIYAKAIDPQTSPQQGLSNYQTNIYKEITYAPMASKGELLPYRDLNVYTDTHRSLTAYEMGILRKPCCNCSCHIPSLSSAIALELESQRPSVIMVPAKRDDMILNAPSQVGQILRK